MTCSQIPSTIKMVHAEHSKIEKRRVWRQRKHTLVQSSNSTFTASSLINIPPQFTNIWTLPPSAIPTADSNTVFTSSKSLRSHFKISAFLPGSARMASRVIVWDSSRWAMMIFAPAWARAMAMAAPIPDGRMSELQMGGREEGVERAL